MASDWMTRKEAAAYLSSVGCPVAPKSLANMACSERENKGPAYAVLGWRTVRYDRAELDRWANARRRIVNDFH